MRTNIAQVICATATPLHADAVQTHLQGYYDVIQIGYNVWHDGLKEIETCLQERVITAVIVDSSFPHDPMRLAQRVHFQQPTTAMIFITDELNIFKVLRCLEGGYSGYLYLGDELGDALKRVVDHARRGERYLSQSVRGLYDRYKMYRGLFTSLSDALASTFKLMGEGLSVQEIVDRTGLHPTVIYRRQYRLRQHFGVETNQELMQLIQEMYGEPNAFAPLASS